MLARVLKAADTATRVVSWKVPANGNGAVYQSGHRDPASDAQAEAEVALLRAEVSRLRIEAEQAAQEGFKKGRAEGERLGKQAVDQELEAEVATVRRVVQELKEVGPQLRRQTEEQLVRLSISVARRIIHRELTIDTDALEALIKAAFDKLEGRSIDRIRTDPENADAVRRVMNRLGMQAPVRVIEDPTLRRGSLLIDFPSGQLDASVETQLSEIERGFVDIVRHS